MGSNSIKSVRGMNDILPPESVQWNFFEDQCRRTFSSYGYQEIRTPILESTSLFSRGIGEATDIVEKEMYTFADRKGRSMTMRPEMTASCVRAYIQHSMAKKEPITRWYYMGPMFRYERTQTGRYRQFYQIGVEAFGIAEASLDAEQIAMLYQLYRSVGISNIEVLINTVGSASDRPVYRRVLLDFLTQQQSLLCSDCQRRIHENPLRVLDCKVPACKEVVRNAPSILDHLGQESLDHYALLKVCLEALKVPYRELPTLVRGLDYYTGTVVELVTLNSDLGAQNTIAAGGRYNGLVESLGGPSIPAVGFALGVERAIRSLPSAQSTTDSSRVYVGAYGELARIPAIQLVSTMRNSGLAVELEHRPIGMKAMLRRAAKLATNYAILIGEREIAENHVVLRDMVAGTQTTVPMEQVCAVVQSQQGTKLPPHNPK